MFKKIFKRKLHLKDFFIIDETSSDDKNKIEDLLSEFILENKFYNRSNFRVNIVISDHFTDTVYNYSSYEQQQKILKWGLPEANGQYCGSINNIHTIVINKNILSTRCAF